MFINVMPVSISFVRLYTVAVSLYRINEIQRSSSEDECLICCKTCYCGMWHSKDRASWHILIIKANKMHYFSTLFW